MKLVKKILRLLPLICALYTLLFPIFTRLPFDSSELPPFNELIDLGMGILDYISDAFNTIWEYTFLSPLVDWVVENISSSVFILLSMSILIYELYLSLMFLIFDFINMVFSWSNKLINKGGNLDD